MSGAFRLREAWAVASTRPLGTGLRAAPLDGARSRIWATVSDSGEYGVLVVVGPKAQIGPTVAAVAKATSALKAEVYPFSISGVDARGLLISCANRELLDAFTGFCDPFIGKCQAGESVEAAFRVCFEEFRRLVSPIADDLLPPTILGLMGELFILSELVQGTASALNMWAYPTLERHDFRNGDMALEVKTTLRSQQGRRIVSINAIDQLDPPSGGTLFLHWLQLERDVKGAMSIHALVDQVLRALPSALQHGFNARLSNLTNFEAHSKKSFVLLERDAYVVVDDFPRLTGAQLCAGRLDPGVAKVKYELDLAAAHKHRRPHADANSSFLSGVSRL